MSEYRIKSGQSLYDVSVQLYGDTSHVLDILTLNPTLTTNSNLEANTLINYDKQNTTLTNYLNTNTLNLATTEPRTVAGEDYGDDYGPDYG